MKFTTFSSNSLYPLPGIDFHVTAFITRLSGCYAHTLKSTCFLCLEIDLSVPQFYSMSLGLFVCLADCLFHFSECFFVNLSHSVDRQAILRNGVEFQMSYHLGLLLLLIVIQRLCHRHQIADFHIYFQQISHCAQIVYLDTQWVKNKQFLINGTKRHWNAISTHHV